MEIKRSWKCRPIRMQTYEHEFNFICILKTCLQEKYLFRIGFCDPPCQNGECIEPGICKCEKDYDGDHCENKKDEPCNVAPEILNSEPDCSPTKCQVNCADGYGFSDGSKEIEMLCKGGQWETNSTDKSVPACSGNLVSFMNIEPIKITKIPFLQQFV